MAQFDVYENPGEETRHAIPYLLDLQANIHDGFETRIVAPLVRSTIRKPIKHLNPKFEIEDDIVFMATTEISSVLVGALGKRIGSLEDHRNDIIAALDFLFTGF